MIYLRKFSLLIALLCTFSVQAFKAKKEPTAYLQPAVFSLTMVMLHDVVNPPAASRFYSYSLLGAHEILAQHDKTIPSPSTYIKGFPKFSIQHSGEYDYHLAALYAILETGKRMLPSGFQLEEDQKKILESWKNDGYSEQVITNSINVAQEVSQKMVAWAKNDGYLKLSTLRRYKPIKGEGNWYPTPPAYMEAVEPNWRTIRPMMMDTCNQFKPIPPVAYSAEEGSEFYKLAKAVYDISKNSTLEQRTIAAFWDCNPFAINTSGHMSIGFKKMSPGGHWMNITSIVSSKAKLSFGQSLFLQSLVATTLMDAFISCWDEKYRSNRIRPETVINKLIDIRWQPLLQTPPFPEYTSGHSVISTASAEVLTYFLGDSFEYVDDSEIYFDLQPRKFTSFRQAASEAGISRFYGGIHYMDAIENGQTQGANLGKHIVKKMQDLGVSSFVK